MSSSIRPANRIIASSAQLRKFVYLSHYIHVLAHLCIERMIQRCLEGPLGQRQYPPGFGLPTWTEEQRTVLAFWRLLFWNQLKIEGAKGSLGWSIDQLERLARSDLHDHYHYNAPLLQGFAALGLIAEISPVERSFDLSESPARDSFSLPSMPSEFDWVEFDWVCEPPPSSKAITQGRTFEDCDHDLAVMFPLKQSGHPQQRGDDESSPEAAQDPSHDLRAGSSPEHSLDHSRESPSQSRPDLTGEAIQPPRRPARFFYGTDSEDVSSDDNEWSTAEDFQEDTEDEESSSDSGSDTSWDGPRRGVNICIYRDPTLSPPDEFYNRGRPLPYAPRPVRDYGSQSLRGPEWEDLDREPLGIQFWRSMSGDPPAGPAKYMQFHPYARYGFAFWEEQRMMQLGLWSHQALDDPVEYYRRWYTFLSQEDRSRTYGI
ncbi:uncharacterized WD repeat-containing protein alr2800 [Aspergillus lentulus]|uniref:Uncharacterized WD repeat-containing protein alr2800 n=1 Tax=Aspergillus lentulus TaxID=293939 RepID=A0ABQ1B3Z6_ASPLE|nr:uncharacterized WD repeat-containing protein alr2800 [Aspergillus lentulus]KAF4152020.1 hypothetical protein CNMCM6069_002749 [Aspergillus lentulus]GFF54121.1 uncharacterized WD repeat-containing protein alr2800 [Aspergillus lentulus]GFF78991.1 uncharacterized WD repeat-containing protein alr2800 [Aspergillus lentulus]GFF93288.1 uncharacterized WD repeat-containing protein alr2800 [Aspergillus lentulus]GFG17464.1 uncharacterized WD repeat-containing protein alr2800 [Aspergillus lentulus]